jgi:hypothetical protein
MKIENFWEKVLVEVGSNSIKSIIVIILTALMVLLAAIYNPLLAVIKKYVPLTILFILLLSLIILLLISFFYILHLRRMLKSELKSALGVYWDKNLNPYCPSCKKYLGNYAMYPTADYKYYPGFKCISCKDVIRLSDGIDIFMDFEEAKKRIENLFNK